MNIHMIGVKGTGMSSLAILLKDLGHIVSGSDYSKYIFTQEELKKRSIKVKKFNINNLKDINLVVVGHNFIDSDNIELVEAKKRGIRILEYNECLASLLGDYYSIGVSGSSGKSTTTALISTILNEIEDTSFLIGSGEARGNKKSEYFTFEACEYKRHFLKYYPNLILVNNIDYDHIDYFKSEKDYINAFFEFIKQSRDKIIVNGDDKNLKKLRGVIFFGIKNKRMYHARNIKYENGISYDLYYKNNYITQIKLNMYGEYMVYNTLAAISVCLTLGLKIDVIIEGLKKFKGVKRRFKETIVNDDVYIDDYAHHPSKIRAIISAIRDKYKNKKIIAFYRPDRISRLDYFTSSFIKELLRADEAYIMPYISDNEEERESINRFLSKSKNIKLVDEEVYKRVSKQDGVIYLMMSSKDVSEVKEKILKYKR